MANTKHTPGPWGIYEDPDSGEIEIRQAVDCRRNAWTWEKIASDVTANNAHLIAAAPDLLQAAELCREAMLGKVSPNHPAWHASMAAIAKAEGRDA